MDAQTVLGPAKTQKIAETRARAEAEQAMEGARTEAEVLAVGR